jgi:hypothetical protein
MHLRSLAIVYAGLTLLVARPILASVGKDRIKSRPPNCPVFGVHLTLAFSPFLGPVIMGIT